ncbi:hypothetical protein DV515_00019284, partial [Chloebia gouldiae]
MSASIGETIKITCSGSSYSNYAWFQQKVPGSGPVTVIYGNNQRPSGIPSSTATLTITGVQAEDEAVYFCGGQDSSGAGSLVQAALTQPSSVSAKVGDTVRITCSGSSGSYGWFQQKVPGSAPVTVIYYNDQRPSGIPSRFSGSKSGSTATLTITGVQAEDEAVYFCGSDDDSSGAQHHGGTDCSILSPFALPFLPAGHSCFGFSLWLWGPPLHLEAFGQRGTSLLPSLCPLDTDCLPSSPSLLSLSRFPGLGSTESDIICQPSIFSIGWFQQKVPGSGPVTVIYIDNKRPSGIPSSTNTLTITGVQAKDKTVYFCGSNDGSNAGSLVQAAVTQQPSSLSAKVGDTVSITCSGSSNSYYGWYQQKVPGSAPVTVIYSSNKRPSGIPSRFSGSGGTLTITGVQAEDEAVYICGGIDSSYVCLMKMTDFQMMYRGNTNGILLFFSSPSRVMDVRLGQEMAMFLEHWVKPLYFALLPFSIVPGPGSISESAILMSATLGETIKTSGARSGSAWSWQKVSDGYPVIYNSLKRPSVVLEDIDMTWLLE